METTAGREAGQASDRSSERGSILFVARNNVGLTKQAVASARQQDIPCDILVIDNTSTDGTKQWLVGQPISSVAMATQASLSACWNIGLSYLLGKLGRPHALVCNTDIELRPDAYRLLLAHGGPFVTCVSVDTRERMGAGDREAMESLGERPHPDFSCFLIRPEVVERVGWFNEDYWPAFVEDCEYHVRMHRAGVPAVCIDVPFLHHGSATIKNASQAERNVIARGAQANRERFKRAYGCLPGTPEYQELFR